MGTKKQIVGHVADVISHAPAGPLLDLFAGVSSVGSAVSPCRNVWCNDVQHFAHDLATSIFCSRDGPELSPTTIRDIASLAAINSRKISRELAEFVYEEERVLADRDFQRGAHLFRKLVSSCTSDKNFRLRRMHRRGSIPRPYRQFAITYVGGYIGISQAIELDSVRYALDQLCLERAISIEQHRWSLLALCKALANASNTTGHFAQYLAIKEKTYGRFLAKRRRSIFGEWQSAVADMSPAGTAKWRKGNRTFRKEATELLRELAQSEAQPSVIYADPPYTNDHYSRYYHLLDTLMLYDYPDPVGKGQYRSDRFVSDFSLRSKVHSAFEELVSCAAKLGCDLIINYPDTGLIDDPQKSLLQMLKRYFRRAEIARAIAHEHSSLGASNGSEKSPVTELIFHAH
jgi:adenine-specific DNA-methyltransferase